MSKFHVIVKTAHSTFEYDAIGESSAAVCEAAVDCQEEPCGVTVRPA